ncbi:MAG: hypothetical protein PWQ12_1509 [Clostridiales bacterium]|nr:hypothetical protein [Clostridiales bacterium]
MVKQAEAVLKTAIDFIWPEKISCLMCDGELEEASWLCRTCEAETQVIEGALCTVCGRPIESAFEMHRDYGYQCKACQEQFHYFSKHRSFGLYEGRLKKALMQFKYHGKTYFAPYFGERLFQLAEPALLEGVAYVIPVPIHTFRRMKRGYNQSELIVKAFCAAQDKGRGTGGGIYLNALKRIKSTRKLKNLDKASRKRALQDAIIVKNGFEKILVGKTVLLVDDIFTTGTTLDACAKALYECGAEEVRGVTVAMGVSHK